MIINQTILFSTVVSVFFGGHVQGVIDDNDEFTLEKFQGLWYDMGEISSGVKSTSLCNMFDIVAFTRVGESERSFLIYVSTAKIDNASYGFQTRMVRLMPFSSLSTNVKSYNKGSELIITVGNDERRQSQSYKLVSRARKVSEETKAEFEKLAGNTTAQYHSWDDCPNLTLEQLQGVWYDMGKISTCVNDVNPCSMHEIKRRELHFVHQSISIEDIGNCTHGVPIYSEATSIEFVNSTLHIDGYGSYPPLTATVKSYNNDREFILFDAKNSICGSPSYRLFSRERKVSVETKAEFEKLAGNAILEYYSWDDCPKLRSETDDEFTVEQLKGTWYNIAVVSNENFPNITCAMDNVTVKDYQEGTFNITTRTLVNGNVSESLRVGGIRDSLLQWKLVSTAGIDYDDYTSTIISCNRGKDFILHHHDGGYELLSRNSKVSNETMVGFRKIAKNYPDRRFVIFDSNHCQDRIK